MFAGDGAANVGAGRRYAKIAIEIFDLSFAVAGWSEFIKHDTILQRSDIRRVDLNIRCWGDK